MGICWLEGWRARKTALARVEHMGADHGRGDIGVAGQILHRAEVVTALQQTHGGPVQQPEHQGQGGRALTTQQQPHLLARAHGGQPGWPLRPRPLGKPR
jgi:4-hydroxy-3-methylbut-2-enyl diphosphate reductase IspH